MYERYLPEAKVVAAALTVLLAAGVTVALNALGIIGVTFDQVLAMLIGGAAAVGGAYAKTNTMREHVAVRISEELKR